jgi:hypothetical protein
MDTFTIARRRRTGRRGSGTATRSLAVSARGPHVRARLGAVAIMAIAAARTGTMNRDWAGHRIGELRHFFADYRPAIPYYTLRQIDARVPQLREWLDKHAGMSSTGCPSK